MPCLEVLQDILMHLDYILFSKFFYFFNKDSIRISASALWLWDSPALLPFAFMLSVSFYIKLWAATRVLPLYLELYEHFMA